MWQFLEIRGAFCGCPDNKSLTILGSTVGLMDFCTLPQWALWAMFQLAPKAPWKGSLHLKRAPWVWDPGSWQSGMPASSSASCRLWLLGSSSRRSRPRPGSDSGRPARKPRKVIWELPKVRGSQYGRDPLEKDPKMGPPFCRSSRLSL